jgi:glycolate oxidase FAD binding subunit
VAKAGTPLGRDRGALAAENQRLPSSRWIIAALLGTEGEPTIGGVVAANVSGPRRIQAGAAATSCSGCASSTARARSIKNGGRVMKNVTGYDLVKLMAGSFGTLGVLTEVAFKVLPAPERGRRWLCAGWTDQAVEAMVAALGSPFEVTGAAHLPGAPADAAAVEGFEAQVAYRAEGLQGPAGRRSGSAPVGADPKGAHARSGPACATWRRFTARGRCLAASRSSPPMRPAHRAALREAAEALFFDWGGGLIWALVPEGDRPARAARPPSRPRDAGPRAAALRRARPPFQPEPPASRR